MQVVGKCSLKAESKNSGVSSVLTYLPIYCSSARLRPCTLGGNDHLVLPSLTPQWHVSLADRRLSLSCSWLTGGLRAPRDHRASAGPSTSNTVHDSFQFVTNSVDLQKIRFIILSVSNITTWNYLIGEGSDQTAEPRLIYY